VLKINHDEFLAAIQRYNDYWNRTHEHIMDLFEEIADLELERAAAKDELDAYLEYLKTDPKEPNGPLPQFIRAKDI
jgi:hypothetical protein